MQKKLSRKNIHIFLVKVEDIEKKKYKSFYFNKVNNTNHFISIK